MKNLRTLCMLAVLLFSVLMNAQETEARQAVKDLYAAHGTLPSADDTVYIFIDDEPDARKYLPAPPDTSSMEFMDDLLQFQWGKAQRNTPRGAQASRESLWTVEMMRVLMAEALSIDTISDTETPAVVDRSLCPTECRPRLPGVSGECPCRILENYRSRYLRGGSSSHCAICTPCLSPGWHARYEPHARHRHSKWAEDS